MVARRMVAQAEAREDEAPVQKGAIVNVHSLAADRPQPDMLAYSIASAAQA